MAQTATKKLLVVGGSGFLGLSVCKHAIRQGWETVSLSRRGIPELFKQGHRPEWTEKVQWEAGDSLEPATYQHLLENVTDVVHTVGMISEMDYKQVVGAKNLCDAANGVAQLAGEFIGMRDRGNPLRETPRPTFEMVNRDTTITLAKEAAKISSMDAFVFISASDIFPLVDPRYISTKRQAEQFLFARPEFRSIVLRPGKLNIMSFMYSHERPAATPLATAIQLANMVTKPVAKELNTLPYGTSLTTPPLHIDTVANAVITGIAQKGLKGIFDVDTIQQLSRVPHPSPSP
ncbi:hypothetical protein INT45_004784 [Circinella minor]|uniref:NAD-dependent epimerase/dehydratase domain-containing protein n=1 Tax=Circinella minor TaxID=1195481 RepID=A0A8H7SGK5_9FUNG|nr:hypothetical protein INT45_004784 [Circinella minor]